MSLYLGIAIVLLVLAAFLLIFRTENFTTYGEDRQTTLDRYTNPEERKRKAKQVRLTFGTVSLGAGLVCLAIYLLT